MSRLPEEFTSAASKGKFVRSTPGGGSDGVFFDALPMGLDWGARKKSPTAQIRDSIVM